MLVASRIPNDAETAFFCVADSASYLPKVIVTLLSVKQWHPNAACIVMGNFPESSKAVRFIESSGLQFQNLDMSAIFSDRVYIDTINGCWPSECFWWSAAYKTLNKMGYHYSFALDGDILCVNPVRWADFADVDAVLAGVEKGDGKVNSGVLFFNHANMKQARFYEKFLDIYHTTKVCTHKQCKGWCVEKGDQGILDEMEKQKKIQVRRLPSKYNHMLVIDRVGYTKKNKNANMALNESIMLHYLLKPWSPVHGVQTETPYMEARELWWEFAKGIWPRASQRRSLFGIEE